MNTIKINSCDVAIMASKNNWIEGNAVEQLHSTAKLAGMRRVVGMPDLHPGRGNPIGAAFLTEKIIYPYLVGGDIGCGMGLWQTNLKASKIRRDKWVKKLVDLDTPWDGDRESFMEEFDLDEWDEALGTIGGGNHFAELQKIHKIVDPEIFEQHGLDEKFLQLMVHSGSRGLGQLVLKRHVEKYGAKGLEEDNVEFEDYLTRHDDAVEWAEANRTLIARRFMASINAKGKRLADICHNSVTESDGGWLHRKGAAPTDQGLVLIPGSRGSFSYIVEPIGDHSFNCCSLAHGAGRKFHRRDCRERFSMKYSVKDLQQTRLGSAVICENKDLLFEEAPAAYKDIDVVIKDMVDFGVINVVAILKPIITYKTRRK